MAQQVKTSAFKLDDLSLIPRIHMGTGEDVLQQVVLGSPQVFHGLCIPIYETNKQI